jgi:hypothetical protein
MGFTQEELQILNGMLPALSRDGMCIEGKQGERNGELLGQFFVSNNVRITEQSVRQAVESLRDQLTWKSTAQIEADRIATNMTQQDVDTILQWIPKRLSAESDDLLVNFAIVGEWLQQHRFPVTVDYLERAFTSLHSPNKNPHKGHLLRPAKRKLQDSEKQKQSEMVDLTRIDRDQERAEERRKQRLYELQLGFKPRS